VAGHGTPEFLRCGRLLALCGWGVQQLRPPRPVSAAAEPARGAGRPRLAHAADAAIACALCGAKAGLWQFVPRAAPVSDVAGARPRRSALAAAPCPGAAVSQHPSAQSFHAGLKAR